MENTESNRDEVRQPLLGVDEMIEQDFSYEIGATPQLPCRVERTALVGTTVWAINLSGSTVGLLTADWLSNPPEWISWLVWFSMNKQCFDSSTPSGLSVVGRVCCSPAAVSQEGFVIYLMHLDPPLPPVQLSGGHEGGSAETRPCGSPPCQQLDKCSSVWTCVALLLLLLLFLWLAVDVTVTTFTRH